MVRTEKGRFDGGRESASERGEEKLRWVDLGLSKTLDFGVGRSEVKARRRKGGRTTKSLDRA